MIVNCLYNIFLTHRILFYSFLNSFLVITSIPFPEGETLFPRLVYSIIICTFAAVMTTTAIIISIIFILCLTSPVATRSIGLITSDDKPSQKFVVPLIFGISQGVAAVIGYNLGRLISHLYTYIAEYMVFAMMLIIALKLFVDSMKILKGKLLYTVSTEWDFILLSILAAMNTLIMMLVGPYFLPFGWWFMVAVVVTGFLWSFFAVRIDFAPGILKKVSFIEFSASVFMVIIAILYMFTDLI